MNVERLEIARRLVACPKWVWLPGMAAFRPYHAGHLRIESTHESGFGMSPVIYGSCSWFSLSGLVPDLDDDLTRIGVLAVVRQALGDPGSHLVVHETHAMCPSGSGNLVPARWWALANGAGEKVTKNNGRTFMAGPTELDALLAAMESAPT